MKILITGVAGFIGSALAINLQKNGNLVRGIDNLEDYYASELKERRVKDLLHRSKIDFTKIDLTHLGELRLYVQEFRPDTIIHLAAQPGVRLPIHKNYRYSMSNLAGFSNILQVAVEEGVTDFLYASSSSVYGKKSGQLCEKHSAPDPTNFYGATKLANEILAESMKKYPIRMRALRLFTVYGPFGRPDMAYFKLMTSGKLGQEFELYGDGTISRDFTYIADVTGIISELLRELKLRPLHFHDRVNLGGNAPKSMSELIEITKRYSNFPIKIKARDKLISDVESTRADLTYLHSLIDYRHQFDLETGLQIFSKWFDDLDFEDIQKWHFKELE